jgi:hypothetical protein|tara:strand:+ start:1079 stop:1438 length:360 start_codon:yes stop_codon:yes gene_type:complete
MAFKMKGFSPFTLFNNQNRVYKIPKNEYNVTRRIEEQSEGQKSKFRKKIESGKGLWAKLFGGKRDGATYKPGIADMRLFGGVGVRNLKKSNSAANTKQIHSRANWDEATIKKYNRKGRI